MPAPPPSAVLFSGGLDSAMLLLEEADEREVQPLYISAGLAWEDAERIAIRGFLSAIAPPHRVRPLVALALDMTDVYSTAHWAVEGAPPAYHTPDDDVYLPGRNVVLLSKAAVFCNLAGISRIAIGTLAGNPFPDATPAFRQAMGAALSAGLNHALEIEAPYEALHKSDLVTRAVRRRLPIERTLSCMSPIAGPAGPVHCGVCSKCRERHDAFLESGHRDPTAYHDRRYVGR